MARVTSDDVKKIIETDSSITDFTEFIGAANDLVTELCGTLYSDARLRMIELWLSAHFYAIRDPRMASESAGGVSGSPQGQTSMALSSTSYGQQAMLLDTKGALAKLNAQVQSGRVGTVEMFWLGQERD